MKLPMKEVIDVPSGVTAAYENHVLTVKGEKGEVTRLMHEPNVKITAKDSKITLECPVATKREKRMIYTYAAHVANMIKGVQEGYTYKLKICSGHFPMNVALNGDKLVIKNFLGEKSPRSIRIKKGAEVKIDGDLITIEGPDKELAGRIASDIELSTAKSNRDLRTFQDGIYMIEKAGRKIE